MSDLIGYGMEPCIVCSKPVLVNELGFVGLLDCYGVTRCAVCDIIITVCDTIITDQHHDNTNFIDKDK